jgi:hypothetical protein
MANHVSEKEVQVTQIGGDLIRIRCKDGYEISVMVAPTGTDAFVTSLDGTETIRLRIEGPRPGQRVSVVRHEDGTVDLVYKDI